MTASMLLFLLVLANLALRFLPEEIRQSFSMSGSLARRIHYYNVMLVGGAFLVIGFMTYRHFTKSARETERTDLDYHSEALLTNLKTQTLSDGLSADSLSKTLPKSISLMATSMSMDVNLYGATGDVVYTTQEELMRLGLLPAKMNPTALFELRNNIQPNGDSQKTEIPPILPIFAIRDAQNQLQGFLGVPYDLAERNAGMEVSDFLGMLASLYVFLLLIAFVITYVFTVILHSGEYDC